MTSFGHQPDQSSGDWIVSLPADASIGEVIVYRGAIIPGTPIWVGAGTFEGSRSPSTQYASVPVGAEDGDVLLFVTTSCQSFTLAAPEPAQPLTGTWMELGSTLANGNDTMKGRAFWKFRTGDVNIPFDIPDADGLHMGQCYAFTVGTGVRVAETGGLVGVSMGSTTVTLATLAGAAGVLLFVVDNSRNATTPDEPVGTGMVFENVAHSYNGDSGGGTAQQMRHWGMTDDAGVGDSVSVDLNDTAHAICWGFWIDG